MRYYRDLPLHLHDMAARYRCWGTALPYFHDYFTPMEGELLRHPSGVVQVTKVNAWGVFFEEARTVAAVEDLLR